MSIKELINEACKQSKQFQFKYEYWVLKRKKKPDLDWIMSNLEEVLGKSYVREQAQAYIDSQNERK